MKFRWFFISIMFMPIIFLSACATKKYQAGQEYGLYCSKESQCKIMDAVRDDGAFVYQLGDTISIVVPQDQIFKEGATLLSSGKHETLDNIADLLAGYQKMTVKIIIYIANDNQSGVATMRAQALEHYLMMEKINARLLYSVVKTRRSSLQNNIEFVTRKLP